MSYRGSGANLEPLPFVRSFNPNNTENVEENKDDERSKSSHRDKKSKKRRERSGSRDRHRDRRRSKSRSRDRDSRKKKRRRSRSRSSSTPPKRRSHRDSPYERSSRHDDDRERSSKYDDRRPNRYETYESKSPVQQHEEFPSNVVPIFQNTDSGFNQNNGSVLGTGTVDPSQQAMSEAEVREQRRKSRWSSNKAFVPGMPTILPSDLDDTQTQIYLLTIEIEECTRKLRLNEFMTTSGERSPSPEPIYDNTGKRLNTREVRKKQELEQRRHEKIMLLKTLNLDYKPPADYRPPNIRLHEKVWIPQEEHPEINFVGLLIGPRGNTLKALEQETGARIIIRGKGSIKEGKLLRRDGPMPGENEPLHAYVTGTDMTVIKKACERIQSILDDALIRPDANNLLRQHQLRELAVLNGTLRPEDILGGTRCSNCGSDQHKTYECPEQQNVTANIICSACGAAGHIARDCLAPRQGYQATSNEELDSEYSALMAEISGAGPATQKTTAQPANAPFKLPPPQLNIQYTRPPVRQFPTASNQFYASQPRHPLPPPPAWPPELMGHDGQMHLDPAAAAAAFEAMNAASNGGAFPFGLLPPPPPPPPSMPDP